MNSKTTLLVLFVLIGSISLSYPTTLRELWETFKQDAQQFAEELKEEILNLDLDDLLDEEKRPKKTVHYAQNHEEAVKTFQKLKRKYTVEFECVRTASNKRKCLEQTINEKLAHRSNEPYIDYFEQLKTHNQKAQHDYKLLRFFERSDAEKTKEKLEKLQRVCKETFKKELRERHNSKH